MPESPLATYVYDRILRSTCTASCLLPVYAYQLPELKMPLLTCLSVCTSLHRWGCCRSAERRKNITTGHRNRGRNFLFAPRKKLQVGLQLYQSLNIGLPCIKGPSGCSALVIRLETITFTLPLCLWPAFHH